MRTRINDRRRKRRGKEGQIMDKNAKNGKVGKNAQTSPAPTTTQKFLQLCQIGGNMFEVFRISKLILTFIFSSSSFFIFA